MSNFKEIVTKAVVGKGKKSFREEHILKIDKNASTILGCWVINHNFKGIKEEEKVKVTGSFDVNIWYSKDNNTETEVIKENVTYEEIIPIKKEEDYDGQDEVIVRILKQPTCTKAEIKDGEINYIIEKTIAAELVGDAKIKIGIEELKEEIDSPLDEEINDEIKEDFLN